MTLPKKNHPSIIKRTMKSTTSILATIIVLFLSGCSEKSDTYNIFSTAEQLMNTQPDSSLHLLEKIDSKQLVTKEGKARYALLYSQALDKNYIDVTNDSLINIAVDYYKEKSGHKYYSMLSHYYKARVEYNRKSYSQSIVTAAIAEKLALEIEDYFHLGYIYQCLSQNYTMAYNSVEELRYIEMAYECFKRAGREIHSQYCLMNIARAHTANRDYKKAIDGYEHLLSIIDKNNNVHLFERCLHNYAHTLVVDEQFCIAKNVLLQLNAMSQCKWEVTDYCNLARIYNKEEKSDSALYYLNKAKEIITEKTDSVFVFRTLYEMCIADNNHKDALSYLKKIDLIQDSITDVTLEQAVIASHRDYLLFEAEQAKMNAAYNKNLLKLWVIILIALIAILFFAVLYYHESVKRKNIEIKTAVEDLSKLNMSFKLQKNDLIDARQQIFNIFSNQFTILDELVNTYLDFEGSSKSSSAVLRELEKCIAGFSSQQRLDELNDAVNSSMNNIVERLSEQVPSVNKNEINLFLYLCAQFSPRVISLFMNDKLENIYNKKSRLKKKIINSNAPDAAQFLRFF